MADNTIRYVDDTEPIKMSLADDGIVRTDLATCVSIVFLAVNQSNPTDTFGGTCTVIDETDGYDHWNAEYALLGADTAAPGIFNCYATTHEASGDIATYAVFALEIKDKT